MPNSNRPAGLVPVGRIDGTQWSGRLNLYYIPLADANAYAIGDPLTLAGSSSPDGRYPSVTLATAGFGNLVLGALCTGGGVTQAGPYFDPANLGRIIIPATKTQDYYVGVCDDPSVLYEIQEGGAGSNLAATDVGNNFDLKSGTNNGYISGWLLDNATANTGATRQLKVMGLVNRLDNALGTYAKWLVLINHHSLRAGTAGV